MNRHDGNLLVDQHGRIIHIDFGYLLSRTGKINITIKNKQNKHKQTRINTTKITNKQE